MARIVVGSYMVRYPLGGMMSWVLQYLAGFHRLGHEVWFVEKSVFDQECYDPVSNLMTDDPTYGLQVVEDLLASVGLRNRLCFVDAGGRYHGRSRAEIEDVFAGADLYVEMGTHDAWVEESQAARMRVFVDGEPGFCQMQWELREEAGERLPEYEAHYTTGRNVGTAASSAPTAGREWRPLFHPVVVDLFPVRPAPEAAPYTTVMNWQSHRPVRYRGREYGQKNREFPRFETLPQRADAPLELAVFGKRVPAERLRDLGWRLRDSHAVTMSFDSFRDYIAASRGEFAVCKNVFVATRNGWFSDRGAAYLASGRPVVMQDTGFGAHLPCGEGLFAVSDVEEAAAAIESIEAGWERHSRAARAIAETHLEASVVLGPFLDELGIDRVGRGEPVPG
jgi:hypothetical protein